MQIIQQLNLQASPFIENVLLTLRLFGLFWLAKAPIQIESFGGFFQPLAWRLDDQRFFCLMLLVSIDITHISAKIRKIFQNMILKK